jgi:hypothetical protein
VQCIGSDLIRFSITIGSRLTGAELKGEEISHPPRSPEGVANQALQCFLNLFFHGLFCPVLSMFHNLIKIAEILAISIYQCQNRLDNLFRRLSISWDVGAKSGRLEGRDTILDALLNPRVRLISMFAPGKPLE